MSRQPGRRLVWKTAWLPAVGLAILPKCPLCLAALGTVGLTSALAPLYRVGVLPLLVAALLLLVVVLWRHGREARSHGPVWLAAAASLTLLAGKFWLDAAWLLAAGLIAVSVAVAWSGTVPGSSAAAAPAPDCGACSAPSPD